MADKEEVEPTDESSAAEPSDAVDSGPEASDDKFEEIVRGSGLSGSHALGAVDPDGADPEPTDDDPADDDPADDDPTDDDHAREPSKALEPAGVGAAAAGSTSGTLAERRAARKPKEAATKRRDTPAKPERTGPVKFVRESVGELRKVVYPTGQQLINYFVVVLVFVLFIITYVSLLDLGLGSAIFKIFS